MNGIYCLKMDSGAAWHISNSQVVERCAKDGCELGHDLPREEVERDAARVEIPEVLDWDGIRNECAESAMLAELVNIRKMLERQGERGSSVKIDRTGVTVHVYAGSPVEEARQEAIRAYQQTIAQINDQGATAFEQTLKRLRG